MYMWSPVVFSKCSSRLMFGPYCSKGLQYIYRVQKCSSWRGNKVALHPASAAPPCLTLKLMLLSFHVKSCSHCLSNQQILVIMSDATKKQGWLIEYFLESWDLSSFSVGKCFPCVVGSLMFERQFCSGALRFLTMAGGIFRCWLWIISCNDGSAWHVCLDSMPSSWNTDQTELSYRLQI